MNGPPQWGRPPTLQFLPKLINLIRIDFKKSKQLDANLRKIAGPATERSGGDDQEGSLRLRRK